MKQLLKTTAIAVGLGLAAMGSAQAEALTDLSAGVPTAKCDVPAAFNAKTMDEALKSLNASTATASDQIVLNVPETADNGAIVPVTVRSDIPGTTSISILSPANPLPLIAKFSVGTSQEFSTRIKVAKTSKITVIVKAGGKAYTMSKDLKIPIGGCGG